MSFELKTHKNFNEIVEKINHFKKLQNENLFGLIEEFDFQNIEFNEDKIIINKDNTSLYSFLSGKGKIEYIFLSENIIEIILEPTKLYEKKGKLNIIIGIIILVIINIYSIYLYKEIKYTFVIFSIIIILLQFLFFIILDKLNLHFLKDYAIKFYLNLEN